MAVGILCKKTAMEMTLEAHSADSAASNDRYIDNQKGGKHRCLRLLRMAYGSETFMTIAAYAPMTCMPALVQSELESIARVIRESIESQTKHWLVKYIDRPNHTNLKVSAFALAKAVRRRMIWLDDDGIYVLLMLRSFNTSWASLEKHEIERLEEWDSEIDTKEIELRCTPLVSAIKVHAATSVRLFLEYRADPSGYQERRFDDEGDEYQKTTPLFEAISIGKPHLVDMLLQARADPNQWGFEQLDKYGEDIHPYSGTHFERVTPLWQAVKLACDCSPRSPRGLGSRGIVRLLISHNARPDCKGKIEYFSGCDSQSDYEASVDSDGLMNTSDDETTPLEAACKRKAAVPDPEMVRFTANPSWSIDVVNILGAS